MAENENKSLDNQEDKIDIIKSLVQGWKIFKKTWWLLILLVAISSAVVVGYRKIIYTPEYTASASFTVTGSSASSYSSTYITNISIAQLGATFPYILESGALKDVVCEDIGVETLPGTISASVLEDTNLFQIKVVSDTPEMAVKILDSIIANYPTVARYVIGDTELTMLDNSGMPTYPSNSVSIKRELMKGGFAAIIIYLIAVFILSMTRKTVGSEHDLKRYSSMQCLAHIPRTFMKRRSNNNGQLVLLDHKVTPGFVESINTLRVRTIRRLKETQQQVVMVTSSSENEGKTTVVSNLALSYALKGYRTLLIDADLRNPSVGKQFNLEEREGFDQVLAGKRRADELIVQYDDTKLDILPGGEKVRDSKVIALLHSERFPEVIVECRRKYDYIFIDTPPCGMMQDAAIITEVCDSAVMVIRQDYIARDRVVDAMEFLSETGISILGYTMNYEEMVVGSYGYGRYGYGKGYGKYGYGSGYGYGQKKENELENTAK